MNKNVINDNDIGNDGAIAIAQAIMNTQNFRELSAHLIKTLIEMALDMKE